VGGLVLPLYCLAGHTLPLHPRSLMNDVAAAPPQAHGKIALLPSNGQDIAGLEGLLQPRKAVHTLAESHRSRVVYPRYRGSWGAGEAMAM
jgi:hypothetical protein